MFLDGLCDHAETPDMPTGLQNLNFRATQEIRENPGKIRENPGNPGKQKTSIISKTKVFFFHY